MLAKFSAASLRHFKTFSENLNESTYLYLTDNTKYFYKILKNAFNKGFKQDKSHWQESFLSYWQDSTSLWYLEIIYQLVNSEALLA